MPMSAVDDAWSYFVYDDEGQSEADIKEKEHSERAFDCGVGASLPFARVTARCKCFKLINKAKHGIFANNLC